MDVAEQTAPGSVHQRRVKRKLEYIRIRAGDCGDCKSAFLGRKGEGAGICDGGGYRTADRVSGHGGRVKVFVADHDRDKPDKPADPRVFVPVRGNWGNGSRGDTWRAGRKSKIRRRQGERYHNHHQRGSGQ